MITISKTRLVAGVLGVALFVASWGWTAGKPRLMRAPSALPESALLDVHIVAFEPASDFFPEVRQAESRYVAVGLKRVFEASGFWGSVRVVPEGAHADVALSGAVTMSHGRELRLEIRAVDATGKVWLDKEYKGKADASTYLNPKSTLDPFQNLYHRIANDAAKRYRKLDAEDIGAIRDVSRLRFAADLAPDAFADYLDVDVRKKRYAVSRLPSRDDPMMERVVLIRQRDGMFVDTVDSYYARLFEKMHDSYHGWRSQDYWQREAMKNGPPTAQRSGGRNAPWGVLTVGGRDGRSGQGVLCGTPNVLGRDSASEDEARWEEALRETHLDILRELGQSLAADVAPLVVEVEGNVAELTGSVEAQYAKWRVLMRELFAAETGLPVPE